MTDGDATAKLHVEGVGGNTTLSKATTSTQLAERRIHTAGVGVKPPYNPDRLAAFLELNETLAVGIRKKARYEVGLGFDLVPHPYIDADNANDQERAVVRDFWRGPGSRWQTSANRAAEPATPEEVKELARQDYHLVGWLALEVLTNNEGKPVGLAHVPARTIRVRRPQGAIGHDQPQHPEDGRFVSDDLREFASRGYVQVRNGRRRYFGEFGDRYRGLEPTYIDNGDEPPTVTYSATEDEEEPVFVDRESGDVALGSADALENEPANELIFIKNPNPLEDDYGVPDWVSAIRTISADEAAKDYNREFFQNDTIPRFVIKVTGGELSEESRNDLEAMLDGLREESHRAVILEVEKFQQQIDDDVEIELEPLGQGISEEMDFRQFREKNEHEIAKVLEMPPIKIGVTESANYSNSDQQDKDFALEVIQPEQHKFSTRLYKTLHQTAFGVDDWTLDYELRGADQPKQEAKLAEQRVRAMRLAGVGLVDEAREELGLEPLGEPYGSMTLQEFEEEFGGNPTGEDETAAIHEPPEEYKVGSQDWDAVKSTLVEKDPIEQVQFSSSNLDEGLYDFEEQTLYLSFIREGGQNSLYAYVDVPPSEWAGLVSAGSAGGYHYDSIRLEYPYLEITNFHDRLPEGPTPDPGDIPEGVPSEL
ncbi:phage portal protein [Halobacterium sp. KA-6]|uniref:phage portal protein n=1 Tax=Halobacterium sp. KA-6 TaxID=2896368 RepID=UPI001E52F6EE|nr:phage portal protein [Halobacterium sp. KA-6]MCD2204419.1 phage portal protein [Halobacterium sp. KA-6]